MFTSWMGLCIFASIISWVYSSSQENNCKCSKETDDYYDPNIDPDWDYEFK